MNYQDFESSFMKENRFLKIGLVVCVSLLLGLLIMTRMQRAYFIYQGGEIFKENILLPDICKEGFSSIVKKKPHSFFVTDSIISVLKSDPFEIESFEISYLKAVDKTHCRLIAKTISNSRAFLIELKEDNSYPFAFKISGIKETEVLKGEE